jgi:sarcosine oxidase subunit beta
MAQGREKADYDVVIIGGAGHGLATAYYPRDRARASPSWRCWRRATSAPQCGRNTTIIRSNYLLPGNEGFYEWSMKLWEGLEQSFNYNAMVSQRGVLESLSLRPAARRLRAARQRDALHGVDAELARPRGGAPYGAVPRLRQCALPDPWRTAAAARRHARHDAVVWGYARGADMRGVDIVENCEVTGLRHQGRPRHVDRHDARHDPGKKVGLAVAGNTSRVGALAGCGCRSRATCCRPSCRKASSRRSITS